MYVKDFADQVQDLAREIGCDGKGSISSHRISSDVSVISDDPDDDSEYEFVCLEPDMLPGCGCWSGIVIHIKRRDKSNAASSK